MKNLLVTCFIVGLFSCTGNNSHDDQRKTAENGNEKEKNEVQSDSDLKQNGDYSSLFQRDREECRLLTIKEVAEALKISETAISNEAEGPGSCSYLVDEDGNRSRFLFKIEQWGKNTTKKEIESAKERAENFGPDSKLSQYKISESGDTYLSMHQNRMVRILNEKNENAIIILYAANINSAEENIEKVSDLKDVAREHAYALANYLLNKYKE